MYSQVSKSQLFYVGPGELDPRNPSSCTVFGQYDLQQELPTIFAMSSTDINIMQNFKNIPRIRKWK